MTDREADYRWAGPYMKKPSSGCRGAFELDSLVADLEGKSIAVQSTTKPEGASCLTTHEPHMPEVVNVFSFSDRSCLIPRY